MENSLTLSVIIPAYNEEKTIEAILKAIVAADNIPLKKEIIIVDDCSTDSTTAKVDLFARDNPGEKISLFRQDINMGKGAAIHRGIDEATGDYIVIQDADLEYDPREYADLLRPVIDGWADIVYGSRFLGSKPHRILFFWHSIGNRMLTTLSNMFTNLNLTDMETCYKLFRADILKSLYLVERRFGFEPEVTSKISRIRGIRIYEVGVSYYGRTYDEGKKINWKDGFRAIYCILKYNIFSRRIYRQENG